MSSPRTAKPRTDCPQFKKLTLKELEAEKIAFGKAKLGVPFSEAFADYKWAEWFIGQYEKSTKEAHQKYVMYVEKKLDQEIKEEKDKKNSKTQEPITGSEVSWNHVKTEVDEDSEEEWGPMPKMMGVSTSGYPAGSSESHVPREPEPQPPHAQHGGHHERDLGPPPKSEPSESV